MNKRKNYNLEHFMKGVQKTDSCWIWMRHKVNKGYGGIWWKGKQSLAHRVSYELHKGKIPKGLVIDHLCRNEPCVNPAHLEVVTYKENYRRGLGGEYISRDTCINGHPYTKENSYFYIKAGVECRNCRLCIKLRMRKRRKILSTLIEQK